MKLIDEANGYWVERFQRILDDGLEKDVVPLLGQLERFIEYMDENEQPGVFDWGQTNEKGTTCDT